MNAFDSNTPTICVIASPLQALCLVSAIRNLHMTDYKIIVIRSLRQAQVENVLTRFGERYEIKYAGWHRWKMRLYRFTSFANKINKYKRLILGDFRSTTLLYFGLQYVSDGADIVYVDDGNATLSFFKKKLPNRPLKCDYFYARTLSKYRKISLLKYYYSIYTNIVNDKYVIKENKLNVLSMNKNVLQHDSIYILGTNTKLYCNSINITEERFLCALNDVIVGIRKKHPYAVLIYIPHGRDTSKGAEIMCQNLNIEYKKINVPVELFLLDSPSPLSIYGFGSSALYNVKMMFPNMEVNNCLILPHTKGFVNDEYMSISEYYKECGISQIKIEV